MTLTNVCMAMKYEPMGGAPRIGFVVSNSLTKCLGNCLLLVNLGACVAWSYDAFTAGR